MCVPYQGILRPITWCLSNDSTQDETSLRRSALKTGCVQDLRRARKFFLFCLISGPDLSHLIDLDGRFAAFDLHGAYRSRVAEIFADVTPDNFRDQQLRSKLFVQLFNS